MERETLAQLRCLMSFHEAKIIMNSLERVPDPLLPSVYKDTMILGQKYLIEKDKDKYLSHIEICDNEFVFHWR